VAVQTTERARCETIDAAERKMPQLLQVQMHERAILYNKQAGLWRPTEALTNITTRVLIASFTAVIYHATQLPCLRLRNNSPGRGTRLRGQSRAQVVGGYNKSQRGTSSSGIGRVTPLPTTIYRDPSWSE